MRGRNNSKHCGLRRGGSRSRRRCGGRQLAGAPGHAQDVDNRGEKTALAGFPRQHKLTPPKANRRERVYVAFVGRGLRGKCRKIWFGLRSRSARHQRLEAAAEGF